MPVGAGMPATPVPSSSRRGLAVASLVGSAMRPVWIPAFAGMTMAGAGMTASPYRHPRERGDPMGLAVASLVGSAMRLVWIPAFAGMTMVARE